MINTVALISAYHAEDQLCKCGSVSAHMALILNCSLAT
jgi:hypothetical protein